jgi:outer membrane lipoprotein-sorting protein
VTLNGGQQDNRGVNTVSTVARARWAVPAGAVAVVGIVVGATAAAAAAAPSLPPRSAAQLLADVGRAATQPAVPYTAAVQQTANLGLPQLPAFSRSAATSVLTSGTQSVDIWYADPQHVRIAVPVQAGESDARLDGQTLWLWDSTTQTATRVTLPGGRSRQGNGTAAGAPAMPVTPEAAASQLLRAIGPSTVVGVQSPVYVANRPAYQISLSPKSSQSLVGRVLIAIDASRGIPLRVEVYGHGGAGLAYSIGFSSLSFGTPSATNFSFTPPPGATVKKEAVPSDPGALLHGLGLTGELAGGLSRSSAAGGRPTVIGANWLSVVATRANSDVAAAVRQLLTDHSAGTSSQSQGGLFFGSSSSSAAPRAYASASATDVPVGPYLAPLQALLVASRPVSGSWGSGRLLQTTLLTVLVTSKGQILVGAVSPSVLYADVAKDAG